MKSLKLWIAVMLILGISGILLRVTAFASDGDDNPNLVVMVSEPSVPVLSVAVRDLERTTLDRTLNREEINPIKNPGLFLPDFGLTGSDTKNPDLLAPFGVNEFYTPIPLFTFEGQGNFGQYTPPDTTGDVGPNHYIQMVNVYTAIYDKSGTLLTQFPNNALWAGFGGPCQNDNNGDPIVLYDDMADRWMLSQFAVSTGTSMCLAVSQTSDPLGAYYLYEFPMPDFPDYPKLGVWSDGYYLGTNTGYPNQYYAHVFERDEMLVGGAAGHQYVGSQANFLMPADADGQIEPPAGEPGIFYTYFDNDWAYHPAGVDRLAIFEFDVDWNIPSNSTFNLVTELPIASFNYTVCGFFVGDCIPQPSTSQHLDDISVWPMVRLQYRNFGSNEAMVGNFTVDVDGTDWAGIRWFELSRSVGGSWILQQEGTFAPDSDHRWMGSIAMDGDGNIALGYSVSSATTYPSIRYTVHESGDPIGTMQAEATLWAGTGSNTGPYDRWGDYSAMVVDPVDQCTFWYTNEYHNVNESSAMWNTRVGVFKIPSCIGSLNNLGTLSGRVSDSSNSGAISGALVTAVGITSTVDTTTDVLGYYTSTLSAGSFNVTADAYGFQSSTVSNVEIFSGSTTTQDFALTPALMYTVEGTVTDANLGWPLYAHLSISGDPFDPSVTDLWTDPVTGYYQIDLAEGITYTFDVEAWVPGYLPASADVGPLSGDTSVDFSLDVNVVDCTAPGYTPGVVGSFYDGFESGYGGWTMSGLWNAEAEGDTCGSQVAPFPSPTNAAYYGQDGVCTYLTGSSNTGSLTMTSPVMLPPASQLTFQSFEETECGGECGYDNRYVQISTDSGATWTTLGEGSTEGNWYQNSFDLSVYGGMNAQIRFSFDTIDDFANGYFGWMIDNVTIDELVCNPPVGGGLVVGNVYDENSQEPLNGAIIENEDGYIADAQATPLDERVGDGFYSIFSPSGSKTFTATMSGGYGPDVDLVNVTTGNTISHDFYLPAPSISVDPTKLEVMIPEGYTKTVALEIRNLGALASDFELIEVSGSPVAVARHPDIPSASPERLKPVDDEKFIDTPSAPATDVIQDGGFEAGTPNAYWTEASTNFGTPICDVGSCGTGTGTGPRTGAFWAWFGGIAAFEDGQVDQDVIIPVGTASLNFWLEQIVCDSASDYLEVLIDGSQIFLTDGGSPLCGVLGYSEQTVDISSYADGGVHNVAFHSEIFASSGNGSNFFVDDVQLDAVPLLDIQWLSTDPITGTLSADSMQVIDVTFDTLTYTIGTYTGVLKVKTDDPVNTNIEVPVTMHVEAVDYDVEIVTENDYLSGEPGSVVTYTIWITNAGNVSDGYDLAAGSHIWDMDIPPSMDPIEPGDSHAIEVAITIPPDANDGDSDSVTITASSQGDPAVTAEIILMTEAIIEEYMIYLPLVSK